MSGKPYIGALPRLIRIEKEAPTIGIRWRALAGMLTVSDRTRALEIFRQRAVSSDEIAEDAISYLITDANGGSWSGIEPTAARPRPRPTYFTN
jgi:hypothetical protein